LVFFFSKGNKGVSRKRTDTGEHTFEDVPESVAKEDDFQKTDSILDEFEKFCQTSQHDRCELSEHLVAGVKLLRMLSKKRVPFSLYQDIFAWHKEHIKCTKFVPKENLLNMLNNRYNMENNKPKEKMLELPKSKARISLVYHDAKQQVVSLLTDPRICDDDYLFHNDDPFAAPPEEFETVGDINTGRAYRATYKKLIEPCPMTANGRRKVLMPILHYMDGAVTGQFQNLPIEQMKICIGILKGKARDKAHAWRILGYIKNFLPEKSKAFEILAASENMDAKHYMSEMDAYFTQEGGQVDVSSDDDDDDDSPGVPDDVDETINNILQQQAEVNVNEDEVDETTGIEPCDAQDLHTMMDAILESYRKLEE